MRCGSGGCGVWSCSRRGWGGGGGGGRLGGSVRAAPRGVAGGGVGGGAAAGPPGKRTRPAGDRAVDQEGLAADQKGGSTNRGVDLLAGRERILAAACSPGYLGATRPNAGVDPPVVLVADVHGRRPRLPA